MKVATIQADWSEAAKIAQSRAEKSANYNEDQLSIDAMYQWSVEGNQSVESLNDCNDHTAAAVMISLKQGLLELVHRRKETINIITDSPTSQ